MFKSVKVQGQMKQMRMFERETKEDLFVLFVVSSKRNYINRPI